MARSDRTKECNQLIRLLAKYTAQLLLHFNVKFKSFSTHLKKAYVLEARKKHIQYNFTQLSVRTGIDRRFIADLLKTMDTSIPAWPEKDHTVMQQIVLYCERNQTNTIKKTDGPDSFSGICSLSTRSPTLIDAIAIELIRKGWLIDQGDHYLVSHYHTVPLPESQQRQLETTVKRLSDICNRLKRQ